MYYALNFGFGGEWWSRRRDSVGFFFMRFPFGDFGGFGGVGALKGIGLEAFLFLSLKCTDKIR